MKVFFLVLALFSSSVYAGTFVKEDQGNATWNLSLRNKAGNVVLTRYSSGIESKNLSLNEQLKVMSVLGWLSSLGTIANEAVAFENSDERSQETVSELVQKKMMDEMSKLNIEVKDVDIKFANLNCQEKGFFKKQLSCSAQYQSRIEVDLK